MYITMLTKNDVVGAWMVRSHYSLPASLGMLGMTPDDVLEMKIA